MKQFQNDSCQFNTLFRTVSSFYSRVNLFQRNNFDHPPPDVTITCCLYFVAVCQRRSWLTVCLFDPPVHLSYITCWQLGLSLSSVRCAALSCSATQCIATRGLPLKLATIKILLLQVNGTWGLPSFVCDFYIAMDVTCSTSSIFNLVAISIDRWVGSRQCKVGSEP